MKYLLPVLVLLIFACKSESQQKTETNNTIEVPYLWNFSKEKEFHYTYTAKVNSQIQFSKEEPQMDESVLINGKLNLLGIDGNMATVSNTMQLVNSEAELNTDSKEPWFPSSAGTKINADGSFPESASELMLMFQFPIPKESFETQAQQEYSISPQAAINNSPVELKGTIQLELIEFQKRAGNKCVVFSSKALATNNDLPPGVQGIVQCKMAYQGTHCFDLVQGCFIESETSGQTDLLFDIQTKDGRQSYSMLKEASKFELQLAP